VCSLEGRRNLVGRRRTALFLGSLLDGRCESIEQLVLGIVGVGQSFGHVFVFLEERKRGNKKKV
jgi:hypothetical protein